VYAWAEAQVGDHPCVVVLEGPLRAPCGRWTVFLATARGAAAGLEEARALGWQASRLPAGVVMTAPARRALDPAAFAALAAAATTQVEDEDDAAKERAFHLQDLSRALRFSRADLDANRSGSTSARQTVRSWAGAATTGALGVGLGLSAAWLAWTLERGLQCGPAIGLVCVAGLGVACAIVAALQAADALTGQATAVEGPASLRFHRHRSGRGYHLGVRARSFAIPRAAARVLQPGRTYRAFHTRWSRRLLSLEPLAWPDEPYAPDRALSILKDRLRSALRPR
jgi:hypothetical protein